VPYLFVRGDGIMLVSPPLRSWRGGHAPPPRAC